MTDNSNTVDVTDDLNAFEAEFFGKPAQPTEDSAPANEPEVDETTDADDTSPVDDTDATNDTADADAEPDDNEGETEEKPKKKQTAQERINELTKGRREAERRADELERRFAELEARLSKEPEDDNSAAPTNAAEPDPEDTEKYPLGEYDPKYIKDLIRYENDIVQEENKKAYLAQLEQEEARESSEALTEDWTQRLDEAEQGDLTDIREKGAELVNEFNDLDPQYGEYLANTIMSLDNGVDVFYYLANNIDEARKIVAAGPTQATIALGRIEGKILAGKTENGNKVKPKVSSAPTPPPVLNRGQSGRFEVADDTDDLDAFEAKFFKRK